MSIAEKLATIAENEQRVYEAGKAQEWSDFWDIFQDNGTRTSYGGAFKAWQQDCFKPKYNLVATGVAYAMFAESHLTDVAGALRECGVVLDTSQATDVQMLFYWAKQLTSAPTIDTRNAPSLYYMFGNSNNVQSIEKIILKDDGSQVVDGIFTGCHALKEVRFEGVIGKALNVSSAKQLSHDSLMSIINALASGVSNITLTLGINNMAKLTDDELAIAYDKGWTVK